MRTIAITLLLCLLTALAPVGHGQSLEPASPTEATPPPGTTPCLVLAAWHEARGRPIQEVEDIMHVVMNRTRHPAYPSTACAVLLQKGQFSDVHRVAEAARKAQLTDETVRPKMRLQRDRDMFAAYEALARMVALGRLPDTTNGATHFYTPSLRKKLGLSPRPDWAARLPLAVRRGEFVFHRLPS